MKKILKSIWENMKKAGFTLMFLWSFLLFLFVITLDQTTWWLIALFGILVLVSAYMMVNENNDKDMTNLFGTYKRLNKISKDSTDLKKALVKVVEKDSKDINGLLQLIKYSIEQNEKAFRLLDEKINDTSAIEEKLEILNQLKEDFSEADEKQAQSRTENVQKLESTTANAVEILQDEISSLKFELEEIKGMLMDLSVNGVKANPSDGSYSDDTEYESYEAEDDGDLTENNETSLKNMFSQETVVPVDDTPDTVAGIDMGSYMANLSIPTDIDFEDGQRTSLKDEVEDIDLNNFDFGAFLENSAEPVDEENISDFALENEAVITEINAESEETIPEAITEIEEAIPETTTANEESLADKLSSTGVDLSNPNANLSADDIAKLFAASGN